tara:strand:+ start:6000 stop:7853 length:1854 start_codon:yes stop_codon:yes gene_type:complete
MATEILYLEAKSDIKGVVKEVDDLNNSLKKTNKRISDTEKETKKSNKAILDLIGNFRVFGVSLNQMIRQFQNLIPASKRLFSVIKSGIAATGLGLLVVTIGSLIASMKNSVAGAKALEDIMKGIGKVTKLITGSVTILGDAILSVFGYDSTVAVSEVEKLEDAYKKLNKQMNKNSLEDAKRGTKKMIFQRTLNDETKTESERLRANTGLFHENRKTIQDNIDALEHKLELNKKDELATKSRLVKAYEGEGDLKAIKEEINKIEEEAVKTKEQLAKEETAILANFLKKEDKEKEIRQFTINAEKELSDQRKADRDKRRQGELTTAKEIAAAEISLAKQIQQIKDELQYEGLTNQTAVEKAKLKNTYDRQLAEIESSKASQETIDTAKLQLKKKYDGDLAQLTTESDTLLAELRQENELLRFEDTLKGERALADKKLAIQKEAELKSIAGMENEEKLKEEIKKKYSTIQGDITKKRGEDDKAMAKASTNDQISAFGNLAGAVASLAGDNKELAAASAIIDTYVGANKAFAQGGVVGYVGAAAVIASGLANVKKIYETDIPGADGGGSVPDVQTPTPQMMGGTFELSDPTSQQPIQAYVVSDNITDSQDGLAIIRRRATI